MSDAPTRGQHGRETGRLLLSFAALLIVLGQPILWAIGPADFDPMFGYQGAILGVPVVVGIVGQVGGFVWMLRIHRANPEPDQHAWRYQRFPGPAPRR